MIFILLTVFTLVFAEGEVAKDYKYSKVVCEFLENEFQVARCDAVLADVESKFCGKGKSFFTDEEIGKFYGSLELDYETSKKELEEGIAFEKEAIEILLPECLENCEKKKQAIGKLYLLTLDVSFDSQWLPYTISNYFSLAAVCQAVNPASFTKDGLPIFKSSFIEEIGRQCEKTKSIFKQYAFDLADAAAIADPKGGKDLKDQLKLIYDSKAHDTICPKVLELLDLQLDNRLTQQLWGQFEGLISPLEYYFEVAACYITFGSSSDLCQKSPIAPQGLWDVTTSEDTGATYGKDEAGFDGNESNKGNEGSEKLIPAGPSTKLGGPKQPTKLEGWHIALIAVGCAIVLALCIGLGVFFGHVKPKKAAAKKSGSKKSSRDKKDDKSNKSKSESSSSEEHSKKSDTLSSKSTDLSRDNKNSEN